MNGPMRREKDLSLNLFLSYPYRIILLLTDLCHEALTFLMNNKCAVIR